MPTDMTHRHTHTYTHRQTHSHKTVQAKAVTGPKSGSYQMDGEFWDASYLESEALEGQSELKKGT